VTLKGDNIAAEFQKIVEQYVADTYPSGTTPAGKTQPRKDAAHA
jgi:hypothetical protein